MRYTATINKRVRYVRVYRIVKRVNQNTNVATELMQKFVDKFFLKGKKVEV